MTNTETKPAYKIPSMAEIFALPENGLRVVSLCSGCGGGVLGLRWAGYRPVYANDFASEAGLTFKANFPGVYFDGRPIEEISGGDIIGKTGLRAGELDLLECSPPVRGGKKPSDGFDGLIRLLGAIRPRAFISDVPRLLTMTAGDYRRLPEILHGLKEAGKAEAKAKACGSGLPGGYAVTSAVVDAKYLGVPQSRERVLIVGTRLDVAEAAGGAPALPSPQTVQYTLADACPWLAGADAWAECQDPAKPTAGELEAVDISQYPVGKEAARLKPGEASGAYHSLIRCSASRPAFCITHASNGLQTAGPIPPNGCRKFTTGELKRISSFPDDFVFTGSREDAWGSIGDAVAPLVYRDCGLKLLGSLKHESQNI